MTREETAAVLKILRLAYPTHYSKMRVGDMNDTLDLWATIFMPDDPRIVTEAVRDLIQTHTGFPPEIADVKTRIREIVASVTGGPTDEELWLMLLTATGNGYYGASEEFAKLPPVLKRWCGSPSRLRDLSIMPSDTLGSVIHGQFLREIKAMREQEEFNARLSPALKEYIAAAFGRLPGAEEKSPNELNAARNRVLDALESGE